MKKMILFRFDTQPDPQVSALLSKHIKGQAQMMQIPGAVITLFHTNADLVNIDAELSLQIVYRQLSTTPLAYMLMDITQAPFSITLPEPIDQAIKKFINSSPSAMKSDSIKGDAAIRHLRQLLNEAVIDEDYDRAAQIRDEINNFDK